MIGPVVVDCWASQSHYLDHVTPVWRALDEIERGHLYVPERLVGHARSLGVEPGGSAERGDVLLTASWTDARTGRRWPTVALMEHGVGQNYRESHPAYAGSFGRCDYVDLFLCPNERVAAANRAVCPDARIAVTGSPYLDQLAAAVREPDVDVGFAWHWNCDLNVETRATWPYWWPAVEGLAKDRQVLGHGHPRAMRHLTGLYRAAGIPAAGGLDEVVRRCRVVVGDNSSALFYAAAVGVPVVVLNHPSYRRDVHHGLRFWDCAGVGVQCDHPDGLAAAVEVAMAGPGAAVPGIVGGLFPWRGQAVERAVGALAGHDIDGRGGVDSVVHREDSM